MKYLRFLGFLGLILLFAQCESEPQSTETTTSLSKSNVAQKHEKLVRLERKALDKVDNWQEYQSLREFLTQYQSISPYEALNNSKELNDLVASLKDSVSPEFLEVSSFKARVNLLHNETLRLFDMSHISSIKDEEVNQQVAKVLKSFSSVNLKINTILKQDELDRLVDDPKFNRIFKEKDSTPKPKPKSKAETTKKAYEKRFGKQQVKPNKETAREKKMRISKEQRVKKRQLKLQEIQKKQDDSKKKKNQ
jgi:hypothetical protein